LRLKKKNKLEKSQQDDSAPSAPQTQQTVAPNTVEIQEYLSRNTKAIPLPELFHKDDNTYAPLILDGASGMGKMQQAFALLKTGKWQLIYLNLSDVLRLDSQRIYSNMHNLTMPVAIEVAIPIATKQVKAYAANNEDVKTDHFLVTALRKQLENFDDPKLYGLKKLVEELQKLVYNKGSIGKVPAEVKLTTTTMKKTFNKVLFVNEVLPWGADAADHLELQFLWNLGRAMGMHVVLTGTAAMASNMITEDRDEKAVSTSGDGGHALVEIVFLWQVMEEEMMNTILPGSLLKKISLPKNYLKKLLPLTLLKRVKKIE